MKKAKLVLALALVITLIGAFIASGVQTVGGAIKSTTSLWQRKMAER